MTSKLTLYIDTTKQIIRIKQIYIDTNSSIY